MTSSMLRRQLKNLVQNYSEAEVKVREATSNDPWGPSSTQMADISDLTYNAVACSEIMTMLWKRLKDDRNWRHIHKSLTLLEYLLKTGDDRVLLKMKDNIYIVKALTEYRFVEKDGKDQGVNVREKAKVVLVLMEDDDKLKEEREFAVKTREKTSKSSAASSADTIKDPNYKPCYVPGAAGLPSLDNIPSVADLTASFAARKEERLRQEAEKKEVERRAKMSEDELKWEDAGKSSDFKVNAWGGEKAEEKEEEAEEVKPDPWGAPKEPKEATDPWGTPTKPNTKDTAASSDPWGAPTTAEEDSFTAPKADEDPFTSTKTEDPFAAPKDGPDPFSASKDDPFNAPKDSSDPFSAPKGKEDPFAAPVDKADPFSSSNNDPFNAPKDDPFNAPKDDPFNAPKDDPFSTPKDDPFNAPKDDPFTAAKEDPFNAPKDDPFSAPKDDPFGSPKDDPFTAPISTPPKEDPFAAPTSPKDDPFTAPAAPPKEDPFSAPAQNDPFAAPTTPPKDDPFSTVSKPPEDDPFAAPTTPPKEDPFSAPSKPAPDDPFAAPTSPPKEDPFVAPKEEAADPFSAPPVSSPPGGADTWGPPAISPATTGADPWGASSPPKEMKGGDPWGNGASASSPVDNSDPFGDTSKPDNDPWGAPASAPANTDDAWGSAAPPSDSSPSSDPFGDGASKSKDPWGATTNATNDATGKRTAQEELYRKTSSFLGSAGASLVDLDDLFSSNPKPGQRPVANALAAGARGPVVRSGASLPETSAPPSSHVAPSPTYRAANPSSETPFFQSFTTGASYSGFSSLQAAQAAAPPGSVGANPQIGLYMTPLCGGAGAVQAGQPAANPLADPRLFGAAGMNPTGFFGGNFQVGGVTPQGEGGGVSLQPQMLYGGGGGGGGVVDETVNKNNNPFLF